MQILVTGANGFVGRNLCATLSRMQDIECIQYDINSPLPVLDDALNNVDCIFHLAGVNRPQNIDEFAIGNTDFTKEICNKLSATHRSPKIVFCSSIQAELDNPYGKSKLEAEKVLERFAVESGANVVVYRLKNLFGKWCRPNYNSVTATFCYNIAHNLPIQISNPDNVVALTYIDDVVAAFTSELQQSNNNPEYRLAPPLTSYTTTLGKLADHIYSFHNHRTTLLLPNFADPFIRALYATYLSYLEPDQCAYTLNIKSDNRGSLAEFIKAPSSGQIFISHTKPGITRGNHFHNTKTEKFMVVQGDAVIALRHINGTDIIEFNVSGDDYRVVDIPPGYTHSISNIGTNDLVTLFWSNELFDPSHPDTYFEEVKRA